MKRVTIFGGSGFIGRNLVAKLAKTGAQIILVGRDVQKAEPLKVCGDPGQIVPVSINVSDPEAVRSVINGSDAVVNLLGILFETGKQSFERIHHEMACVIAEAVRDHGNCRLIHMSALGASSTSPAQYARTKAAGEEAVRSLVPDAMIVRPSVVFGPDDGFFNRFGAMSAISPFLPLVGGGDTRFQPVFVGDVVDAMMLGLTRDEGCPGIYELGGPNIYSFKDLMDITLHYVGRKRWLVKIPFFVAKIQGAFLQNLPTPPLTYDQVLLLEKDNIVSNDSGSFADLGITPRSVHSVLPEYMDQHRSGGRFVQA